MVSHIALILAYITLTMDDGKQFYNTLNKNTKIGNLKNFDSISNKIMLNFVDTSKNIFGLNNNNNKINNIINKNLLIVAKVFNELNLYDFTKCYDTLLNYMVLHDAIENNNYLLVEYILQIIKLGGKDINKIYSGCVIKKNLVQYLIDKTIHYIEYNNNDNDDLNTKLKIYELLLKYGAIPANCNNWKNNFFVFTSYSQKKDVIIKMLSECFENVYIKYLNNFIYEIKLMRYPEVITNMILNYL
jgi:hypothetical protein